MATEVPYVNSVSAAMSQEFEVRFVRLPTAAGVIFVSVRPEPSLTGVSSIFTIFLGLNRGLTEETGQALVHSVLQQELADDSLVFRLAIVLGSVGAHRDPHPSRTHTLSS